MGSNQQSRVRFNRVRLHNTGSCLVVQKVHKSCPLVTHLCPEHTEVSAGVSSICGATSCEGSEQDHLIQSTHQSMCAGPELSPIRGFHIG